MRWCLVALAIAASSPSVLAAQMATATLHGVVRSGSGAPLPAATIDVTNTETGATRQIATGIGGEYTLPALEPGTYELTARAIGYRPVRRTRITVVLGQQASIDFTLALGGIELEPVVVTAGMSPEINRSEVSTTVVATEIERLPLNGRDVLSLASITPGIRSFGTRATPAAGAMSAPRFVNLYVDGVEWKGMSTGSLVGQAQAGSLIPLDAIREYRVSLNPYDAEYTRGASWVISAVTHEGGNALHGSLSAFEQDRGLVAKGTFQEVKPDYHRQQIGGNVRGPIIRDRLFFSLSYAGELTSNFVSVVPGRPSELPARWDDYAGTFRAPVQNHAGLARLTFRERVHTIDAIWSTRVLSNTSGFGTKTATGSVLSRDAALVGRYGVSSAQLRDRYTTSSLVNEISVHLLLNDEAERPYAAGPTFQYPGVQVGRASTPSRVIGRHLGIAERLSLAPIQLGGSHVFRFGIDLTHVDGSGYLPGSGDGFFRFATDTSTLPVRGQIGVGYLDPASTRDARRNMSGWIAGAFVQDQWHPVNRLMLSLGVRYDAEINTLNQSEVAPWGADTTLQRAVGERYLNSGDRRNDLDNLAPRASVTWDLLGNARTFVRAGYGVMYDRVPLFGAFNEKVSWSWRTYTFNNPGTTDPAELRRRVIAGAGTAIPNLVLLPDQLDTPAERQWSVGIGHTVSSHVALNVDYLEQHAEHLPVTVRVNRAPVTGPRPLTTRYGDILLWGSFGDARFRGLLGSLSVSRGQTRLTAAYTLGWAESEFSSLSTSDYPDSATYKMQRSNGDERHRLVISGLTDLPFGMQFSTIATVASPRPFFAFVGTDANHNNAPEDDWPNGIRTARQSGWSNWYRTIDVRLGKSFRIPPGSVTVIADVFNVGNWANHSDFQNTQSLLGFGEPTADFPRRQAQLGLRYQF